ncbi:MAG: hypothetical protein JSV16_08155, partial [Candidatus Hydrogenedentota bacterium]
GGCYITTPDPLPVGSQLDFLLQVGERQLRTKGVVLYLHPSKGMGVAFTQTRDENRIFLGELLTSLAGSFPQA